MRRGAVKKTLIGYEIARFMNDRNPKKVKKVVTPTSAPDMAHRFM